MKIEFKPEMFNDFLSRRPQSLIADPAVLLSLECNRILNQMLSSAIVVYGCKNGYDYHWSKKQESSDTEKAILINVETIVKEPCKHDSASFMISPEHKQTLFVGKCKHCGVELVAEWKPKNEPNNNL